MPNAEPGIRVFIAEDNPVLLQGLERALSSSGYLVQTAADGAAMLDLLASAAAPPDLVLMDIMMPRMSGLEVAKAVQENPAWTEVPVMLITAATEDALPVPLEESGAVDVLIKPFRLDELLSRIEQHVQRARGRPGAEPGSGADAGPSKTPRIAS